MFEIQTIAIMVQRHYKRGLWLLTLDCLDRPQTLACVDDYGDLVPVLAWR